MSHRLRLSIGALLGLTVVLVCWQDSNLSAISNAWAVVLIVLVAAAFIDVLPDLERLLPWPAMLTLGMLLPLVAIFGCVPETDHISDVGLIVATVGLIELMSRRTMSLPWHALAAMLVLWAGVFGAAGRDRAFIGTTFAFWPLLLLAALARAIPPLAASVLSRAIVIALGSAAAIAVARTGALRGGTGPAIAASVAAGAASLIVALAVAWLSTRARPSRPTS